jgi:hypothetical protein
MFGQWTDMIRYSPYYLYNWFIYYNNEWCYVWIYVQDRDLTGIIHGCSWQRGPNPYKNVNSQYMAKTLALLECLYSDDSNIYSWVHLSAFARFEHTSKFFLHRYCYRFEMFLNCINWKFIVKVIGGIMNKVDAHVRFDKLV